MEENKNDEKVEKTEVVKNETTEAEAKVETTNDSQPIKESRRKAKKEKGRV